MYQAKKIIDSSSMKGYNLKRFMYWWVCCVTQLTLLERSSIMYIC